ncbi:hypothetical protein Nmel_017554 [Mimus melanotis]
MPELLDLAGPMPEMLCLFGSNAEDTRNTQVPPLIMSLVSQLPWAPPQLDPLPGQPGAGQGEAGTARPSGRRAVGADRALLVPAVEGQWLEWGAWSRCSVTCANGTQQRTRKCSVSAHGWAECRGAHADARDCSNPTCPSKAPRVLGVWGEGGRPRRSAQAAVSPR